jgi:hypothetical protein
MTETEHGEQASQEMTTEDNSVGRRSNPKKNITFNAEQSGAKNITEDKGKKQKVLSSALIRTKRGKK